MTIFLIRSDFCFDSMTVELGKISISVWGLIEAILFHIKSAVPLNIAKDSTQTAVKDSLTTSA